MYTLDKNIIIANLTERFFVWMPPKTASMTASSILPNLGFQCYTKDGNTLKNLKRESIHNHSSNLFNGHENYSLITTLRNPYTLMYSKYVNFGGREEFTTKEDFIDFLENYFYTPEHDLRYLHCYDYRVRTPNYVIRSEYMFDDYMKIPFVSGSSFSSSGELLKSCETIINNTNSKISDWKILYNQKSADIVYYNFAHVFELGGYDKNSWKN